MQLVTSYDLIDRSQWTALVQSSRTGTWFQSPEAYMLFASQPKLMTPFVVALTHDSRLRAVIVGYITRDTNILKHFFTRRALVIGGPCLADDCTLDEVKYLLSPLARNLASCIYLECRNFNDYSSWSEAFEQAGFTYQSHLNFHVDCTSQSEMEARLSDNRRRQIRKTQTAQLPVVIREADSEQDITDWYAILQRLYRTKIKTPLFPLSFFMEAYKQHAAHFLLVTYNGCIIGGTMLAVTENKSAYEWFECGLNAEYKEQYPSVMATYAGLTYAAQHALPRYDMMGAGKPDVPYGVRDFKSEFGGTLVQHGRWLLVHHRILYRVGCLAVKLLKNRK